MFNGCPETIQTYSQRTGLPASTDVDIVREGDDRSPLQVAELLAALLEDKQSRLYWNALFGGVTAGTAGESLKVVQCGDGDYRTLCPVASDLQPLNKGVGTFVLGILLTETARPQEAAALLRQAIALRPGHADTATALARACAECGELPEAIALVEHVLATRTRDVGLRLALAH